MAERAFYTLSEAAQILGVHYETAARWVRTGKLPGIRVSKKKVLVPKEGFDAFLKEGPRNGPDALPFGSPKKWLFLAGTLTPKEAAQLRESLKDFEVVDEED